MGLIEIVLDENKRIVTKTKVCFQGHVVKTCGKQTETQSKKPLQINDLQGFFHFGGEGGIRTLGTGKPYA